MIKIHDIILFAISIFFMVILISNYITNYISKTKLIEANDANDANDVNFYKNLVAQFANVDADSNSDVDINRMLSIAGNINIPSILQIDQPLRNLSIYPWNIRDNIDIDPNVTINFNNRVQEIADKLVKPYDPNTLCYRYPPRRDRRGGCKPGTKFTEIYGNNVIQCLKNQDYCNNESPFNFNNDDKNTLSLKYLGAQENNKKVANENANTMKKFEENSIKAYNDSKN